MTPKKLAEAVRILRNLGIDEEQLKDAEAMAALKESAEACLQTTKRTIQMLTDEIEAAQTIEKYLKKNKKSS